MNKKVIENLINFVKSVEELNDHIRMSVEDDGREIYLMVNPVPRKRNYADLISWNLTELTRLRKENKITSKQFRSSRGQNESHPYEVLYFIKKIDVNIHEKNETFMTHEENNYEIIITTKDMRSE